MDSIERRTMRKVYLRLLPFCFCLYLICYLDRANIGFAALTMNKDLGLSSYIYGLGAGAFFWGYFLLEVPSNLILERVGARKWIARIMISWGIVSGSFAFVEGPASFFTLRFLLGLAEAGFFPGMILYFTYWFPPYHRARVIAGFMAAIPIAVTLVTVIVCFFGIRAELRAANYSLFDHFFFRLSPGEKAVPAFVAGDEKRGSDSAAP